jgi:uncharacterized protein
MIERKYATMPGWKRILQHRYYQSAVDTPQFTGHVALYCMDEVRAPLVVEYFGRKTTIVDAGYAWLRHYPAGDPHYSVMAQFDASHQIIAWYIDLCLRTGVGPDQIPWLDDLYLDLVVSPGMAVEVKDADELLAARDSGEITAAEYDLAWNTANRIMEEIKANTFGVLALSEKHRRLLTMG